MLNKFALSVVAAMLPLTFVTSAQAENQTHDSRQLTIEYKTFYSHLRKIDIEDTPSLQFAFGFLHEQTKQSCEIDKALIHTQKVDIPLELNAMNRFSLPKERALKLADAEVTIHFTQPHQAACQLSVLLQANPLWLAELPIEITGIPGVELTDEEKAKLNIQEPETPAIAKTAVDAHRLQQLNAHFKTFFDSMGGGLFSFMMPETKGIKLHLNNSDAASMLKSKVFATKHGIEVVNAKAKPVGGPSHMQQAGDTIKLSDEWIQQNQHALPLNTFSHITAWVK